MLPIAGIISLADTALETWNRIADSRSVPKQTPGVEFHALLDKVQAAGSGLHPTAASSIEKQIAALPEVKNSISTATPGSRVVFSITPEGNLFQVLPGGCQRQIPLSVESQSLIHGLRNSGAGSQIVSVQV